jgi:hypothetical protein
MGGRARWTRGIAAICAKALAANVLPTTVANADPSVGRLVGPAT